MSLPRQVKDATGLRFGRLTVSGFVDTVRTPGGASARWLCVCDCGNTTTVHGSLLRNGNTKSCGCLARDAVTRRNAKHGLTRTPEYTAWVNMIGRCYKPKSSNYKHYGGRGITVCDRWRFGEGGKSGVECFLSDMGKKPHPKWSLDRYPDQDGPYSPDNCRWASQADQIRNSTCVTPVETSSGTMCIIDAAAASGQPYGRLRSRLRYGWDQETALARPLVEPNRYPYKGEMLTIGEAAKRSTIGISGITRRLRMGWDFEAAVDTPPQKTGPKPRASQGS